LTSNSVILSSNFLISTFCHVSLSSSAFDANLTDFFFLSYIVPFSLASPPSSVTVSAAAACLSFFFNADYPGRGTN
jgi:hypothetical protein